MQNSKISSSMAKQIIKIVLSLIFIIIIFQKVDFRVVFINIASLPFKNLFFAALLTFFTVLALAAKWWVLISGTSYKVILQMTYIGLFYSMLIPGHIAGDGVKAYKLGKIMGNGLAIGYSVFVDKVLGFMLIAFLAAFGILITKAAIPKIYFLIFGGISLSLFIVSIAFINKSFFVFCEKSFNKIFTRPNRFKSIVDASFQTIKHSIDDLKLIHLCFNLFFGILFLAISVIINMIVLEGLGYYIAFSEWLWITGFLVIIVLIPVTFGGLGLREGGLIVLLGYFSVPPDVALGSSLIVFGLQLLNVLIGFFINIKYQLTEQRG